MARIARKDAKNEAAKVRSVVVSLEASGRAPHNDASTELIDRAVGAMAEIASAVGLRITFTPIGA